MADVRCEERSSEEGRSREMRRLQGLSRQCKDDHYTTSSCAGRIVVIQKPGSASALDRIALESLDIREHPVWFQL